MDTTILILILHIFLFSVLVGACIVSAWMRKPLWLLAFVAMLLIQMISLMGPV